MGAGPEGQATVRVGQHRGAAAHGAGSPRRVNLAPTPRGRSPPGETPNGRRPDGADPRRRSPYCTVCQHEHADRRYGQVQRRRSQDSAASAGGFTQARGIAGYLTAVRRDPHGARVRASAAVPGQYGGCHGTWLETLAGCFAAATVLTGGLASIFHRGNATVLPQQPSGHCSGACPCGTI
jgi:hypothetical protein